MKVKGRGITCLLVSFAVICLVATPGGRACPRRCACYMPTEVHCTFRYLTSIPDSIPPNVERINLGYNSLVRLMETDFSGLTKLELLMLHSNGIHTIPDKTFSDLQALQVLKMSYNKVRKLQKDTFYGLRSLTRLHMDHNNIEFINPEVFYGLNFLRLVHLEGNQLTKLHPDTFVSLSYLQIFKISFIKFLYLSDNFLTSLPQEMVSYMPDLDSLYLHGNPWTCDCHLKWLSDWIQEKPDVIKCKKDRSPSSAQQCPLCMNPRTSKGKPLAMVSAAAFQCAKPTIDSSLKSKSLTILEDSGSPFISPQGFMAPFGSLTLNMTDQSGNEANMVCSIQKPSRTSPIAFTEENDYIVLNTSFSTFLVCNIDYGHIQPVWQILALYSDSPLILERSHLLSETPQLYYKYKQVAPKPEDIFTNIEADLRADPSWLMQDQISLQLNRTATTLSTLQIQYSSDVQITLPRAETRPVKHKWTMISRDNNTKLEHTVLVGGTVGLNCPGQGDPTPHLEWLLADGSKVRAPYVSEDGRILIDKSGKLELQMADSFDTGIYHCISSNYDDADILTYRITVVEPLVEAYQENGIHHTVFIGETLDLPCHSTGIPDASISWVLPGNNVLYQSSRDKKVLNNGTLRILQVTPKDQGYYHCVAANPSGVDFLIFQVSVKMKGQRPLEHDGETEGSGLDESNSIAHLKEPPGAQLRTSALMEAEVGKNTSSTSKRHNYQELILQRRGDSTHRRFRENRRHFPPSARRIDPQHWAALLEKAKKNAVPDKQENTTVSPPPVVTQLPNIPGEEDDSSGMLTLHEEFMVLATKALNLPARTVTADSRTISDGPMTNINYGTEFSPVVNSQILPPEEPIDFKLSTAIKTVAMSKNINPTMSSQIQGTTNQHSSTVFPLLLGATEFQDSDQMGRGREHFQSAPPITVRTMIKDVNVKMLSSTTNKLLLESVNTTNSHQTSVREVSEPRRNHFYSHTTQILSTSTFPSDPHTAAHSQFLIPRNSTVNIPLFRRFGRQRKIGGRGRIISPYRTPLLRRHRYSIFRSTPRGSSEKSTTAFSATVLNVTCLSCLPGERLTTATAALAFPSAAPITFPKADIARPSVSAFTHSPPENTTGISSTISFHSRTLNLTDVIEEQAQASTQTLKSTIASETTLSSKSHQSTTTRKAIIRHSTISPFLSSSSATLMPVPISPPFTQRAVTDNVATPISGLMTNTVVKLHESSRHNAKPQQLVAEVATSPKAHPNAKFTTGTTHFIYSNLLHSTPMPALTTVKSQNSKLTLSPWAENQFWHKPYSEIAEKGKKPEVSMLATTGVSETTTLASDWDGQKNAKSDFDKKPVQEVTTSKLLPFDSLSRYIFEKPRIVGGKAASFTIPANSDAFLPCEAVGNPLPTIHWTRRKQNSRVQVLPNGTLSIQRVEIQDRGQYLCSASNLFGTDHLHVTLSVVSYPPRILERHTKEITVHSGSTVELKCRAEGRPSPIVTWILANQTVVSESSQGSRQAMVMVDGTLVIHNLSIYDRGFYKCVASNPGGQDSLLVKIQVIAAPPVILEQRRQVIVGTWGESLKLPCTAKGTPQPSVYWVLSDGTEVKPLQFTNSKLFLFSNGTLYIRNLASSDRGTYECIATSSTGSERRVVMLTMEERVTSPRIEVASQKRTEVNFGDKLLLNCSATGEPKPQIMWRLPSKAVVDQQHRVGSRIHVYPNGSLFIGSVTEKDSGVYLCAARNKMGDDLILMHVSLRLKPAKIDHKQYFRKQVLHGKDFQVDCKASGSPVPEISWSLPDGTMINNAMQADDSGHRTRRYTLFDNGTLYFNKVGVAEEGDYTCYAQNTLGKDEMKVHLTVITAAPRIRQSNKTNKRIKAGDTAVLDCEVIGDPKPKIFWLLPSNDMISFSTDRYTFHANGSLTINKVKLLDSGEYICVARNPSGDDTKMYKLDVVSKPPLINGLYTNRTVIKATAVRHSKKHFDCRAEGTPYPEVMWIMPDNIFLTAPYYGSRITVHKNGTLEIRNVRLSDSADFICVARNEGGESVLVVQLEVLEMLRRPTFRKPFNEKIVAQLGKSTALNCSVDGNPPPEIIWILPNGTRFSNGPQSYQYLIASNGSFIIYKTTREDAGKYRCAARNKVGYIEKLVILEIGQKPVILTYAPGTVKGISGESLSLHCVSDGIPKPNIKWTMPSGYVVDRPQINEKYILYDNGTLVIKEATAYDRGNYVCKAQNSVGHTLITVPVMIVAYPPRITNRPPRSIVTRTGAAFQLHCVALGVPKPEITWEMPDHSLLSTASKERTHGSEQLHLQGTLVIQNPQTSNSGIYKCTAKNPLGSDYAATYIQVI
uniref:Immunoglobulin superfamily member 10 n=1 Tax=Nomascus leucogenys TaxID=61853 RepID=G1QTH3_NOMLE